MGMKEQIESLLDDNTDKTSAELDAEFKSNPTGSIVLNKARKRAVKAKLKLEQQAIADSVIDTKTYPNAVSDYGEDDGRFVKVYLDGKVAPVEDGG